mmetsp:Transcript_14325/g.53995  ORF Transcript_14325/g.53995 Transcript_14325/m.53995 type:complete len:103 (-) Transcript_14325:181-489(-)
MLTTAVLATTKSYAIYDPNPKIGKGDRVGRSGLFLRSVAMLTFTFDLEGLLTAASAAEAPLLTLSTITPLDGAFAAGLGSAAEVGTIGSVVNGDSAIPTICE